MRFSATLLCAALCLSAPAFADETNARQKLFDMDKDTALSSFDATQQQACLKAFNTRYKAEYTIDGTLAFDEPLSKVVYDRLFWKGQGNFQRGLIFAATVNDRTGSKAGNLMCYYSTTDSRLDFQSAYVLPVQMKQASDTPAGNMIHASLVTLSSKE